MRLSSVSRHCDNDVSEGLHLGLNEGMNTGGDRMNKYLIISINDGRLVNGSNEYTMSSQTNLKKNLKISGQITQFSPQPRPPSTETACSA